MLNSLGVVSPGTICATHFFIHSFSFTLSHLSFYFVTTSQSCVALIVCLYCPWLCIVLHFNYLIKLMIKLHNIENKIPKRLAAVAENYPVGVNNYCRSENLNNVMNEHWNVETFYDNWPPAYTHCNVLLILFK